MIHSRARHPISLIEDILAASRAPMNRPIPVDVLESNEAYIIRAYLPGFSKEKIQVEIDANQVTISAEHAPIIAPDGFAKLHSEAPDSKLHRTISLAQEVDSAASEAKSVDGVLEIRMPKTSPTKTKLRID